MKNSLILFIFSLIACVTYAQEWQTVANSPSGLGRFDDVFFINEEVGWIANGPSGVVFKTIDGGENWTEQFSDNSYFRNIEFLNENVGFLGTLDGKFHRTTDGGETWNLVTIDPNPAAICGLDVVGESTVYGVGAWFTPAWLIKSTDGGETFTYKDMSEYADGLVEVQFIDELHGYASGRGYDGGVILETFDGGDTWTEIFTSGLQGDYTWKLQFRNNNTHIFASNQSSKVGGLFKSFDSGATWEVKTFPDPAVQAVGFVSDTRGWMGGHNSGFYETNDGGDTWEDIGLGASLNRFVFLNDQLAYCAGTEIYRYEDVLDVDEFNLDTTAQDLKITIAPLPIKDRLNITIAFEHIDNVIIELYDFQGKFIKRLVRDQIPGLMEKEYSFDFEYPSGSYLLDIHTNNGRRTKTILKK